MLLNRPIFIFGAHKSGSSLVRALLDDHPQLKVLPLETHFLAHLNWWIQYPLRSNVPIPKESPRYKNFSERCAEWASFCNSNQDRYADSQMLGKIDLEKFQSNMLTGEPQIGEAEKIINYFDSLSKAIYSEGLGTTRVVEKSVEHAEHALGINRLFSDAVFIHIVRNPYANLVTLRKYFEKMGKQYPLLEQTIRSLRQNYYHARRNPTYVPNYHLLKYEDLVSEPAIWLKKIAEWLDIDYTSSLCTPTAMGVEWAGNSISDNSFSGIVPTRLTEWKNDINSLEIALVNQFLPHVLSEFQYERIPKQGNPYLPQRKEWFKAYFTNRLVLRRG